MTLTIKQQLEAQTCFARDCAPDDLVIHDHNVYAILQRELSEQPVNSPTELLKLLGRVNSMIGYCQSLRVGTVITDGYIKRMNEHYIPSTQKLCLLIADLVDKAQSPKRESVISPQYKDLMTAATLALGEMCNTVAPRQSFTDAVDKLDAAICNVIER